MIGRALASNGNEEIRHAGGGGGADEEGEEFLDGAEAGEHLGVEEGLRDTHAGAWWNEEASRHA